MVRKVLYIVLAVCASLFPAETNTGTLSGRVLNSTNKTPIPYANIVVKGTPRGGVSDSLGNYSISGLIPGNYIVQYSFIGFEACSRPDIQIKPGKSTIVDVELRETSVKAGDVVVTAGYFRREDLAPLGMISFNQQEIRRAAGSADDISRILFSMPSVSKVADNSNDLAVRGGSPAENGFYIDNIPIPNINHFPGEGSTGGPIGILNVDFIENVNFLTSGFASSYGDRLSSVVDIAFREGSRDQYTGKAFMSFGGAGLMAEGPIGGDKGSFIISGQKSYLDLLVGAIGTGATPRYGDIQAKAVYEINKYHKIEFLDLWGNSVIRFKKKDSFDEGSPSYGNSITYQNTTGVSWLALWNKNMYSNTSMTFSQQTFDNQFYKVYDDSKVVGQQNKEYFFTFRNNNYMYLNKMHQIEFGAEGKFSTGNFDTYAGVDTNRLGNVTAAKTIHETVHPAIAGAFVSYVAKLSESLLATVGVRADYYTLNKRINYSPRASLTYAASDVLSFSVNGGLFYQALPMVLLSQNEKFKSLKNTAASHIGAAMEYMLSEDTKLTCEIYDKEYSDLPLSPEDPSLSMVDGGMTFTRYAYLADVGNRGKAYTRGIEILLQKKMAVDFYGIVSASLFRSRYQDYNGVWRDRIYDNKVMFSVSGGYKPNREWEFSIKWTYAGGIPYTPFDAAASSAVNMGIIDVNSINAARYPAYHSLNLRLDKKYYFENSSLDFYISTMNTYNRQNIYSYFWNIKDNKQGSQYQWSFLPVGGCEYEF